MLERVNNRNGEYSEGFNCDFCGESKSNNDYSYCCEKCKSDCCEVCFTYAENGEKNDKYSIVINVDCMNIS